MSKPAASSTTTADTGPIIHRFEYDEVGNRTKHVDAEGRATAWKHDKAGRVIERRLPGGQRETMEYSPVGELVAKTDFLGRTTRYRHDAMGRVTSIDYPSDGDVAITYTAMGLRETVTDGHGTTRYSYNRRDGLSGVEYPHGEAVAYEYDAAQNRTALVTAHQRVTYTYDARKRLETVAAAHGTTRYGYDAVDIKSAEHIAIHAEIAAVRLALSGAEAWASKVLGRHRMVDVLKIAQTDEGRAAIASALDQVYFFGGWDAVGQRPIRQVFNRERRAYESGAKTSLPWCTRDGQP